MDDEIRETIERFHEALNRRDLDALSDLITDDIVFEATSPAPDGTRHVGRQAMLDACRAFFAGSPATLRSSSRLATMLLNGSGLALTPTRIPVFTACEASADPPPTAAAAIVAAGLACACWAMMTPIAPPTTGRRAV